MSSRKRKCETCGRSRPNTAAACPICGAARETLSDGRVLTTYAPTIILGQNDAQTGRQGLVVAAPGATSETQLSPSGLFSISVTGSHGLGEGGEPRVKKMLRQRLRRDRADVVFEPGVNSDGEDGIVALGDQRYVLQITMEQRKRLTTRSSGGRERVALLSQIGVRGPAERER